jgi:hypothetical protein
MSDAYTSSLESRPGSLTMRWWPFVTVLGLMLVESCWIVPWYRTVIRISYVASPVRAGLTLGGIMLAAYFLGYFLESWRLLRLPQLILLGGLLLLSIWLGGQLLLAAPAVSIVNGLLKLDPGAVLIIFYTSWMWWRGITLSRAPIQPTMAWRRFLLGLMMLIGLEIVVVRLGFEQPGLVLFLVYLFIGLLTVIFARISYIGIAQGVKSNPFDRRWLVSTVSILFLVIGIATLLGGLLTGQFSLLLTWFETSIRFLLAVIIFIISLPGLLLSNLWGPIMPFLRQFLNRSGTPESPTLLEPLVLPDREGGIQPIPPEVQTWIFWIVLLLVIILLVVRARRRLDMRKNRALEEPESLLHSGEARRLMRKALQDAGSELTNRLRPGERIFISIRIRRIYAQLLRLCEELGHPRKPGQTPIEFLPDMGELFAELTAELELITMAYNRVRYGEIPEQTGEIQLIEAAWVRISEQGSRLKKTGYKKLKTADVKEVQRMGT